MEILPEHMIMLTIVLLVLLVTEALRIMSLIMVQLPLHIQQPLPHHISMIVMVQPVNYNQHSNVDICLEAGKLIIATLIELPAIQQNLSQDQIP